MADLNEMFSGALTPEMFPSPAAETDPMEELVPPASPYDDEELLAFWRDEVKPACFDDRHVFERQWQRNIKYVLGQQWIEYISNGGGWRDKRMAKWIPRPVTNECKKTVQKLRAMYTSIKLGVNVRPNGAAPENVSAAAVADELAPVLHEDHDMDQVMSEFDFWLNVTGNAFLHTFVDYDLKYGQTVITAEQCIGCQEVTSSDQLAGPQPVCPSCGGTEFQDAMDPTTGAPIEDRKPKGKPITIPLSPLEVAFPNSCARFSDVPYVVRMRWRTKRDYQNHPVLKDMVNDIVWQRSPQDASLQLFKSLAGQNDLGISSSSYMSSGGSGNDSKDGIPEYEIWVRPCGAYPDGLVFRVIGDGDGKIAHLEELEAIPGPLPYKDADGNPLFTFSHAGFEHVGGRILASGPLDVIIEKQNSLNQLDSMILLIIQRMSNPVWLEPKGAEIERLTGMPGLVIKYNPLTAGNAKPERIEGAGPHSSLFTIREQYLRDIEDLAGTVDVTQNQQNLSKVAFSALQLMVEQSQSRFSSVFMARGKTYKDWYKFALELEREFGQEERTKANMSTARKWSFQNFKRTQLQGSVSVIVEDGSNVPKTALGMRAAVEHASQLGMLNLRETDQQYEGLKLFGLTRMIPSLDIHIQAALQKQQAFEEWLADPMAQEQAMMAQQQQQMEYDQQAAMAPIDPMSGQSMAGPAPSPLAVTPLKWFPWYNPIIHKQEFMKWANSDRVRELLKTMPQVEGLLTAHLSEMDMNVMQAMMMAAPPEGGGPGGAGEALSNSNSNSAPTGNTAQPAQGV